MTGPGLASRCLPASQPASLTTEWWVCPTRGGARILGVREQQKSRQTCRRTPTTKLPATTEVPWHPLRPTKLAFGPSDNCNDTTQRPGDDDIPLRRRSLAPIDQSRRPQRSLGERPIPAGTDARAGRHSGHNRLRRRPGLPRATNERCDMLTAAVALLPMAWRVHACFPLHCSARQPAPALCSTGGWPTGGQVSNGLLLAARWPEGGEGHAMGLLCGGLQCMHAAGVQRLPPGRTYATCPSNEAPSAMQATRWRHERNACRCAACR